MSHRKTFFIPGDRPADCWQCLKVNSDRVCVRRWWTEQLMSSFSAKNNKKPYFCCTMQCVGMGELSTFRVCIIHTYIHVHWHTWGCRKSVLNQSSKVEVEMTGYFDLLSAVKMWLVIWNLLQNNTREILKLAHIFMNVHTKQPRINILEWHNDLIEILLVSI